MNSVPPGQAYTAVVQANSASVISACVNGVSVTPTITLVSGNSYRVEIDAADVVCPREGDGLIEIKVNEVVVDKVEIDCSRSSGGDGK